MYKILFCSSISMPAIKVYQCKSRETLVPYSLIFGEYKYIKPKSTPPPSLSAENLLFVQETMVNYDEGKSTNVYKRSTVIIKILIILNDVFNHN